MEVGESVKWIAKRGWVIICPRNLSNQVNDVGNMFL